MKVDSRTTDDQFAQHNRRRELRKQSREKKVNEAVQTALQLVEGLKTHQIE